jgi:hypothetical protein
LGITYAKVPENNASFVNWSWLTSLPIVNETKFVAHVKLAKPFVLKVDGRSSRCVMFVEE